MNFPKKANHQIYDYWNITKPDLIFPVSVNQKKSYLKTCLETNIKYPDYKSWDYDWDFIEMNQVLIYDPMSKEYIELEKKARKIISEENIDHLLEAYKRYVDRFMEKQLFYPIEDQFEEIEILITKKIWNDNSMYLEELSIKQEKNLINKFEDFISDYDLYISHLLKNKEDIGGNWNRVERTLNSLKELNPESEKYFDDLVYVSYEIIKSDIIRPVDPKYLKGINKYIEKIQKENLKKD